MTDDHEHDHRGHEHEHPRVDGESWAAHVWRAVTHVVRPHSHDAAESVDSALEGSAKGIAAVKVSLVVLGITALLQAVMVTATGSVALLADTIHNFSDALTALPLWVAFSLSRRKASSRYTYGYGRAEDLAGIFIVIMILLSAVVAGWESVRKLIDPQPLSSPWVVVAAGVIGFLGNEAVAVYRIRVGKEIGSAALVADGLHARTDGFTSLAVVAGALGVMAGMPLADPIVGLLITVVILVVLRGAARDIYQRLMDAVDPAMVGVARTVLLETPGVRGVDLVRLRWIGHRMHAEASVEVDPTLSVVEGHYIAVSGHHRLLHAIPRLEGATVHVSPGGEAGAQHHHLLAHHHSGSPERQR